MSPEGCCMLGGIKQVLVRCLSLRNLCRCHHLMRSEELGAYGLITALVILMTVTSRDKDSSFLLCFPGLICQSIITWTKAVSIAICTKKAIFSSFLMSAYKPKWQLITVQIKVRKQARCWICLGLTLSFFDKWSYWPKSHILSSSQFNKWQPELKMSIIFVSSCPPHWNGFIVFKEKHDFQRRVFLSH